VFHWSTPHGLSATDQAEAGQCEAKRLVLRKFSRQRGIYRCILVIFGIVD
jgi:hypothetical protein